MLSEGSLLGEKGIPHRPYLLTPADSSIVGMVSLAVSHLEGTSDP